jgi:hydroxyacylglutathione hydrolase
MELTGKIHLLQIDFEIALSPVKRLNRFVNVILILGDKITLIDTGVKYSESLIGDYLSSRNRDLSEVERIILSHSHPDHIGSAARIKELTGCKILAHRKEREWIENIEQQFSQRPVPGFFNLVDCPVQIDEFVSGGEELRVAEDITLKFIHSPGHSKGSLNVLFREDGILFTADSIPLKNDIPNYDDYRDLLISLEFIRKNGEFKTLLSSWTPPLTDRNEINRLIAEGEEYMKKVDSAVKEFYTCKNSPNLEACRFTLDRLELPPFLVNLVVDKAFRSHL